MTAGVAALIASSVSLADPASPAAPASAGAGGAPIVLASAEIDRDGVEAAERVASDSAQPVKRKRTARVTSCRCGDQTAEPPQE